MTTDTLACSSLIEGFISGRDTTLATANRIEVLLDQAFPDDEFIQGVVVALARYRPGGHDYTLNETTIRTLLLRTQRYLASL
ncbi:hypothetical protein ABU614_00650 [Lysobacter firmicutimachus]|uniref:Uncharacterized protein n=1 Tax=Lysobacter firmicutimachus TaxID=1792846 RepID=A0AAU8MUP9_9GAMM